MSTLFRKVEIPKIDAPNFIMSPVELQNFIEFEIKRIYFITNPKTGVTGAHSHKIEEEFFIMAKGAGVAVIDRGNGFEEIPLNSPQDALYVGNYIWHHFKDLSDDAVLLALSSTNYNPDRSDYIEDYEEYKKSAYPILNS